MGIKLIHIGLLLFCSFLQAQNGVAVEKNELQTDTSFAEEVKFRENFRNTYSGSDFVYEAPIKELGAWDRFKEWLSDLFKSLFNLSSQEQSMQLVDILLKTLAVILIITVIYLIVKAIMNGEGQWVFGKSSDKKVVTFDEVEANIHLLDFEKLIRKALKKGENRLAIRFYYLWLLKKLAARQIIEWDAEKTNSDYLYEIKNSELQAQFEYVSYLYNYIWYGEFELDEATFIKARKAFEKIFQSIGS